MAGVTLLLLSLVLFLATNLLPGDVGRRILGGTANDASVAALNRELGTDRPVMVQYADWFLGMLQGDMGRSYSLKLPVSEVLAPALLNSAKLTVLVIVLLLPIAIGGGIWAALKRGTMTDQAITLGAASATTIPDFVTGITLLIIFSLGLGWFPITGTAPRDAGLPEQLYHLFLPAMCMVIGLGGYVLRMSRAGLILALESDYARTARLKGLAPRLVIVRHILRNGLIPTIAVVATQIGYIFGGLVVIEVLFNYNGVGKALYIAASQKDFPVLQGGVLVVGGVFFLVTILGDLVQMALDPRLRNGGTR
jgi:peptide/nickel transport system permease protein